MSAMCSHENITWEITDNYVTDRMIENSLIHKFRPRKIQKRTKVLNAAMQKHCGVADYKHYVELKSNVIRNVVNNIDTSDSSSLSDIDYDIIYNSPLKRAKYAVKTIQNYVLVSEDNCKGYERKTVTHKKKSRDKNTERRIEVRKSPRLDTAVSAECINTDWQNVINKNNSVLCKQLHTNILNKRNILKDNDHIRLRAQSSKQSLSPQFDSQNGSTSSIMKSRNKCIRQNHEDFDAIDNELSSENNTISNTTKPVSDRKVQNKNNHNTTINVSNIEFNSHDLHYQPASLEKSTNSDNELNQIVESTNNINRSTAVIESLKNCDSAHMIHKQEFIRGELSYDQLLPDIANFDQHHSTPFKKIRTNVPNKNLPSDAMQDQQKDSGIDEDSEDKLVKSRNCNKIPMSRNIEKATEETLISSPQLKNIKEVLETMKDSEFIETLTPLETDNEEENMNDMSPQTKKRLQQQARLNLVVNSNSSESDDDLINLITKTSPTHIYSSNSSHCSENNSLKKPTKQIDETNCASKQNKTHDILCKENICIHKEITSVTIEEVKLDSMNMKEDIKNTESSYTYENNDSLQSTTNKNPFQKTPNCENVHNDNRSQEKSIESLHLKTSNNNDSYNIKSINAFQKHKQSMLDKEIMCTKSNQDEEAINTELKTKHESEHKESTRASIKCSNTNLNSSYQYKPCNLQQLVQDEGLFVETIPANFTLADLSEYEEAFILNVPNKVLQSNLQDQVLTLKEKSIKFNKSKYRIVCKEIGTTSCIFATGKKQKPYKIINIKNISTITIREKLSQDSRNSDVLKSNSTVSSVPKALNKNQTDLKRNSKLLKISNKKHKRKKSSECLKVRDSKYDSKEIF
ncbi:PREDICTED: putative uncharacterized protein DDB_G0292292 [Cyphomyrmex costatus]|uniref:putative uncharacterized protein DDB_G0292292 n=1 Tax=Cyphomyrmex costatus TaxID=456900 RepID=UPI0008522931|nr:PREDICTED: putative uncharacterized protein DDB_G0292292 [Cyphomyrmex costatus]